MSGQNGARNHLAESDMARWSLSDPVLMRIDSLLPAESPRLAGEDVDHARLLAESDSALPPIIVHGSTRRVIDGTHRLRAAKLRGHDTIAVRVFDGDENAAFVLAVETNIRHGLPLSSTDREAAALRILSTHPEWSDRTIATSTGLNWKTVGAIRRRAHSHGPQPAARIGKDGRSRPVDGSVGRRVASDLIGDRPNAPLREVAAAAGISVATARDVRERLRRGDDPLPDRLRRDRGRYRVDVTDVLATLDQLKRDPSLRHTEAGRHLLRWLDGHVVDDEDWPKVAESVPPHCVDVVEAIARRCAQAWLDIAITLSRSHEGVAVQR